MLTRLQFIKRILIWVPVAPAIIRGQGFRLSDPAFLKSVGVPASSSSPTVDCDIWQDFEFNDTVNKANLEAHDHGAGTWDVSGTGLSTNASAEKATLSSPQGSADTGGYGLVENVDCTATKYATCTLGSSYDSMSIGCWVFVPTISADSSCYLLSILDGTSTVRAQITWRRITSYRFRFSCSGSTSDVTITTLDAWYWITLKYLKLGTCSMSVFDSTGTGVGTQKDITDTSNAQVSKLRIGQTQTATAIGAVNIYYDDVLIDITDATFPLGP